MCNHRALSPSEQVTRLPRRSSIALDRRLPQTNPERKRVSFPLSLFSRAAYSKRWDVRSKSEQGVAVAERCEPYQCNFGDSKPADPDQQEKRHSLETR